MKSRVSAGVIGFWALVFSGASFAADLCESPGNEIVRENCRPGNPAHEWQLAREDRPRLEGFATEISVNRGETVHFKMTSVLPRAHIDIYRLGYYQGHGARWVATVHSVPRNAQPACLRDESTRLVDCGNWSESAAWPVPSDAISGIYLARLVPDDQQAGANHIVFIVRDDEGRSDLLMQVSDATWQAYNEYGGTSLYDNIPKGADRAYKVSYNRPFTNFWTNPENWLFATEYPMVRWLEANGLSVSYTAGADAERHSQRLTQHRVFLSVGHDEYWSGGQRQAVEAARDRGMHLAFFSGNEVFWKTRWEESLDPTHAAYRTLVCYRETLTGAKIDPSPVWTGTWRDPRFSPPADGNRPENALTGTLFTVNGPGEHALTVSGEEGQLRFWRHTSLGQLPPQQVVVLEPRTLGYEWDEDIDNGVRPAGLMHLSSTTIASVKNLLQDYGATYKLGSATHHLTLYRHASGGFVFGAGTVQWAWGLDGAHDRWPSQPDLRIQQATINLFADMGVQPASLQPGLVRATLSTDHTAPISTVERPAIPLVRAHDGIVTLSGSAHDDGGQVGAVEVSVDDGKTWHPAEGRAAWRYRWNPCCDGPIIVRSRAVDDSGNLEVDLPRVAVTVASTSATNR